MLYNEPVAHEEEYSLSCCEQNEIRQTRKEQITRTYELQDKCSKEKCLFIVMQMSLHSNLAVVMTNIPQY